MARYALVIGTSEYTDTAFQELVTPLNDVERLAEVLRDPERCAFDEVEVLTNESEPRIRRAIARLTAGKQRDDLLLLYFSGHGVLDQQGQLYLAAADTEKELLTATGVPAAFVKTQLDLSRSRRQVLILDCCHSGAFHRGTKSVTGQSVGTGTAFDTQGAGRFVLTASDATQYAWEGDHATGTAQSSVFTRHMVHGLSTGMADKDGDGHVTLDELYDYVSEAMARESGKQTPLKFADRQQGELKIAKNPTPVVKPAPLSAELVKAYQSPLPFSREGVVNELGRLLTGDDKGMALSALEMLQTIRDTDDSNTVQNAAARILEDYEHTESIPPPPPPLVSPPPPMPGAAPPAVARRFNPESAPAPATAAPAAPSPVAGGSTATTPPQSFMRLLPTGGLGWKNRLVLGGALGLIVVAVLVAFNAIGGLDALTGDPFGFERTGQVPALESTVVPSDGIETTVFATAGEGWAEFEVPTAGVYDLQVFAQLGDPVLALYDLDGVFVQQADAQATVQETLTATLVPGFYYLRMTDFGSNDQPAYYDVTVIPPSGQAVTQVEPPNAANTGPPDLTKGAVPVANEPPPAPAPTAVSAAPTAAARPAFIPAGMPIQEITDFTATGTVDGNGAWMHVNLPAGLWEFAISADGDTELHLSDFFTDSFVIMDDVIGVNPVITQFLPGGDYYLYLHLYDEAAPPAQYFLSVTGITN